MHELTIKQVVLFILLGELIFPLSLILIGEIYNKNMKIWREKRNENKSSTRSCSNTI